MNAEREAAIRARLERATGNEASIRRLLGDVSGVDDPMVFVPASELASVLDDLRAQATALDAVRELADEWGADHYRDIEATDAADDIRAALAAADDGGTRVAG